MCDEIQLTVEIDARDNEGNTPLHLALYYNNNELIELLVSRGADPSLADLKGLTALHFCHKHQIEMLFEISEEKHRTVEVNAQDNEGNTPLHLAMYNIGSEEAIESLLRHGADPNMTNNEGWTPLHLVCRKKDDYGSVETFFKMCDENNQRVKIDARDELGRTPLQWAVARCWPNIVHVLLDHGADLSNFVFPTVSHFDEIIMGFKRIDSILKLQLISGALSVIETLEKRGYELQQSNVIRL
ncbi:unnamed protein product [Trichogramma brassicae]|uniref:Uncharacterized protein n=1 Tax=Trichogramma brassicae TaxID=86971 RepID=A0A6H5IL38_9HYME|nr:unnamed protein product [Trichogramma brassicae]